MLQFASARSAEFKLAATERDGVMMTLLDLCSYLGLFAVGAITINLVIGMLMALRYSPRRLWPHRQFNLFAAHQFTAYVAVVLILSHPLVLIFLRKPSFSAMNILFPIHSYLQPWINLVGAVALYLAVLVFGSSLLRRQIGRPIWRRLHLLVFPAAVLLFIHSILTDPGLINGHPDLLDGGKVFVEIAALICLAATVTRLGIRKRGFRASQVEFDHSGEPGKPL